MASRKPKYEPPRRAIQEPPSAESLGLSDLAPDEGDDAGISLEELGQTYAALLSKGADPYPEERGDAPSENAIVAEALAGSDLPANDELNEGETASVSGTSLGQTPLRRVVDGDDDQ